MIANVDDVSIDPITGLDVKHFGWSPSLRYLLRRDRVLSLLGKPIHHCKLLEVGCGAGVLLAELSFFEYTCVGVETSGNALNLAKRISKISPNPPLVAPTFEDDWRQSFDVLMSLDVLEHIENDMAALVEWVSLLKPDGRVVLSVPAHPKKWGSGDVWAGHFRRYSRDQLVSLCERSGLKVVHFECYGYPLANLSERIGSFYYWLQLRRGGDIEKPSATAESGINRRFYTRIASFLTGKVGRFLVGCALKKQRAHLKEDIGSGYILVAKKA